MTDAASSISDVHATWKTCLETLDVLDSLEKYGIEYERQPAMMLEAERMRLRRWGNAVGLGDAGYYSSHLDSRLNLDDVRTMVMHHLRGIDHAIENAASLGNAYGLRPAAPRPTQSQRTLGTAFKRAYGALRKSARARQKETPRNVFQSMFDLIRNSNDGLEGLFPEEKTIGDAAVGDPAVGATSEAAGGYDDEASCGSDHIEEAAHVEGIDFNIREADATTSEAAGGCDDKASCGSDHIEETAHVEGVDVNLREADAAEAFVAEKSEGCLALRLQGPYSYLSRVTAHVAWDGSHQDSSFRREDELRGSVKSAHESFGLYKRKRYAAKEPDQYCPTNEDYVLFDVESNPLYEDENPGTVTVEGFGMECWDYEDMHRKSRYNAGFIPTAQLPKVPAKKLLRRVDELRRGVDKLGLHPEKEDDDLEEFFGNMGVVYFEPGPRKGLRVTEMMNLLDGADAFCNFTTEHTISVQWAAINARRNPDLWNLLWQMILAKEVALRLQRRIGVSSIGFTSNVLASLIVQDLWFRNVELVAVDLKVSQKNNKRPETPEEAAKAERFKEDGNAALREGKYQRAFELYTEALKMDDANPVYWCNRAAAFHGLEKWEDAETDAYYSTQFDPTYAKAWSRMGAARLGRGCGKRAKESFQRAIELAGDGASTAMKQGLEGAKKNIEADLDAIDKEVDGKMKIRLRKEFLDRDWDITAKVMRTHSLVHEQQVDGLLVFAEKMKWPYINEVRDFAEEVYGKLQAGQAIQLTLYDWLYGLTLPGRWMSFKIMGALIFCTPSIADRCGAALYYDCGLSLRRNSYWRVRTVLGRVVGCLPGVISLCGWIGPCPPIEFEPPPSEADEGVTRHVRLRARAVAPRVHVSDDDNGSYSGRYSRWYPLQRRPGEDIPAYLAELRDSSKWFVPEPPERDLTTVTVKCIRLKELPMDVGISARIDNGSLEAKDALNHVEYRASIDFSFDNDEAVASYTLYTNPVFVALPNCRPKSGGHEVHMRERADFQRPVWTVDRLKAYTPEDFDGGVMVINVTGEGAEALARAWCSERSKNAVVRRAGGPCYACAIRAAWTAALGVGVLIWVS